MSVPNHRAASLTSVTAVIARALVPTMIAGSVFLPRHLLAEAAAVPEAPAMLAARTDHEGLTDEE